MGTHSLYPIAHLPVKGAERPLHLVPAVKEDAGTLVHRVLRFFGVSSVDAWRESLLPPSVQYRSSRAKAKYPGFVAAWLRMGELQAEAIHCESFNGQEFRRLLEHEVRELTTTSAPPVARNAI